MEVSTRPFEVRPAVRPFLSLILVGLLASCPIVCGTAHAAARDGIDGGHHHGPPGQSGLPAPANDDDCLCNGALKAADAVRALALLAAPILPDFLLAPAGLLPPPPPDPIIAASPAPPGDRAPHGAIARLVLRC